MEMRKCQSIFSNSTLDLTSILGVLLQYCSFVAVGGGTNKNIPIPIGSLWEETTQSNLESLPSKVGVSEIEPKCRDKNNFVGEMTLDTCPAIMPEFPDDG